MPTNSPSDPNSDQSRDCDGAVPNSLAALNTRMNTSCLTRIMRPDFVQLKITVEDSGFTASTRKGAVLRADQPRHQPDPIGVNAAGGSSYVSTIPSYLPGRHQFDYGLQSSIISIASLHPFEWQLPGLAHSSRCLRYAIGGWQLTGLLTVQSGGPLTVVAGKDQSGTALSNDRAWYVGGVDPYGGDACGTKAPCVNYLPAFNLSPEGSWGNVQKGSLRGPDWIV